MKATKKLFIIWIIIMFLITFTCCLSYLVTQQSLRLGANNLPSQIVTDTAIKLENGKNVKLDIPVEKVNISKSLSTFVMIFDKGKNLIATSGVMIDGNPSYPVGVLNYVDKHGEDRVTWQTESGLRFATVATKYDNGYIVAACSLHETENLIGTIGNLVLMIWLICTVLSALTFFIIYYFARKVYKVN